MFPSRALLACVFDEMFIEVPLLHETSPALKNVCLHACTQALLDPRPWPEGSYELASVRPPVRKFSWDRLISFF